MQGTLEGVPATFLIDSGASNTFVSRAFVRRHQLAIHRPDQCLAVRLADGTSKPCSGLLQHATVQIGSYTDDTLPFTVLDLCGFDVVLGKTWLNKLNPQIDWPSDTLRFDHHGYSVVLSASGSATPSNLINAAQFVAAMQAGEECFLMMVKPEATDNADQDDPELNPVLDEYSDVLSGFPKGLPPLRSVNHSTPLQPDAATPAGRVYPVNT